MSVFLRFDPSTSESSLCNSIRSCYVNSICGRCAPTFPSRSKRRTARMGRRKGSSSSVPTCGRCSPSNSTGDSPLDFSCATRRSRYGYATALGRLECALRSTDMTYVYVSYLFSPTYSNGTFYLFVCSSFAMHRSLRSSSKSSSPSSVMTRRCVSTARTRSRITSPQTAT